MKKLMRSTLLSLTLQSFAGLVAAAELPTLDSPVTITGEPTTAMFFAGATTDNGMTYKSTISATELVDITARIQVASEHVGNIGDLYVVASINDEFYNQVEGGAFQPWNGEIGTLMPVIAGKVLDANENLTLVSNLAFGPAGFFSGTLSVFLGYGLGSGVHAYSGEPLSIAIQREPEPETAAIVKVSTGFSGTKGNPTSGASDPSIAVGEDRVVVISNNEVAVSTKSGELIGVKMLHMFFLPAIPPGVSSAGDVAALFDEQSGRFFLAQNAQIYPQRCEPGTCVGFNMLAVSKTSSPNSLDTSDWYFFAIDRFLDRTAEGPVATGNGGDFDKLGADDKHLIITSLQSREYDGVPAGPKIRILDKAKLIAGEAPDMWVDVFPDENIGLFLSGITPARIYSESPVFFFAAAAPRDHPCGFTVLSMNTNETYPTVTWRAVSLEGNCASGDWAVEGAGRGPQLGGPPIAVAGTGFSTIPVFRDGRLWVADRWQQDFGSGGVSVIRWAELDVSQWPDAVTVVQDGTIGEDNVWSFEPSLTVDRNGNLMIGYHTTSADQYPAINVSARLASDPPGTMRPGIIVKAGTGSAERIANGRNRFADYSWMTLDPVDETSWIHGQYGTTGVWETWVSKIQFADQP
jgi:hypothetical protein